jgi:hypothetical protein
VPKIPGPAVALLSAAAGAAICRAALSLAPDDVARIILWPLSGLALAFPPPCFDRGPGREPFCEGTPIQMLAGLLGLGLSWLFYTGLLYLLVARVSSGKRPIARGA